MPTPRKPIDARPKSWSRNHVKCKTKDEAITRLQEIGVLTRH